MGSNCSNLTYVDSNVTYEVWSLLGPRCLDPHVAGPTVFVYCLILLFGVFGNCTTCMVILKNRSMHNATNYYLFSLAISDLVQLLIGLPFELQTSLGTLYPFEYPLIICKGRAFVTEVCSYASILTITAFSVERWLAICFPLKIQLFSKLSRATKVIVFIWIVSMIAALPFAISVVINRLPIPEYVDPALLPLLASPFDNSTLMNTEFCGLSILPQDQQLNTALLNFSFWQFFVLPLVCISVLYMHIAVKIKTKNPTLNRTRNHSKYRRKAERNRRTVLRMLIAVVLAFFICWLPFHAQRIMTLYIDLSNIDVATQRFCNVMFFLSGYFFYANSALNPLLYNAFSHKFRAVFLTMVCPACATKRLNCLSTRVLQTHTFINTNHTRKNSKTMGRITKFTASSKEESTKILHQSFKDKKKFCNSLIDLTAPLEKGETSDLAEINDSKSTLPLERRALSHCDISVHANSMVD